MKGRPDEYPSRKHRQSSFHLVVAGQRGDVVVAVNGEQPKNLADFYRKVWAQGRAGVSIALDVLQESEVKRFNVKSIDRLDHLTLKSTF